MQAWILERKIRVTQAKIIEWYIKYDGKVYIGFSGGMDSRVLLDLVRRIYPNVPAVFCDTGLEYPEIREFVKTINNVEFIYPLMWNKKERKYERVSFKTVIDTYGYPIISKEQAAFIQECRDTKSEKLRDIRLNGNKYGRGKISDKWKPLIDAPFKISDKCCDVMKKTPSKVYEKRTGRHPILGTTAEESKQRESNWLLYGCNAFDKKRPTSQPMSFWTKQDTLQYMRTYLEPELKRNWHEAQHSHGSVRRKAQKYLRKVGYSKTAFASVYGQIVENKDGTLKTTGVERTGCIFCGFGAQCDKEPTRFQRLKETHPKQYEYCIRDTYFAPKKVAKEVDGKIYFEDTDEIIEYKGLGLGKVLDYINVPYK